MKIALIQYHIFWEDKSSTKDKIKNLLGQADLSQVDWLIFPEMSLTGFSMNPTKTTLEDHDLIFFQELAKKYHAFISFGSVVNQQNVMITLDPQGEVINQYAKINLFKAAKEDQFYIKGHKLENFLIQDFRITPFICYDLRFPQIFWSQAFSTDVFVLIANWPKIRYTHWLTLLKARAIETQAYVIGVNRVGDDPQQKYLGSSLVISPKGKIVLNCKNSEGVFLADLNLNQVQLIRKSFPIEFSL
ncbi:MAG: nitrilase-related carbon-nitrogen hydrolase [Candidatus Margulisiibacteriota bacterium]|jgi:predicted amidohydrolase